MLKRIALLLAAFLLLPSQAFAQEETDYTLEGFWAFQIDEAVIFLFEVDQMPDGNWRARWTRPAVFGSNGVIFNRMSGATRIVATEAIETEEGVRLSFPDPRPEAVPNVFLFVQTSDHQVTMTYVDTPLEPFPLIRVVPGTQLGPFDDDRIYDRDNAVTEVDYVEPDPVEEMVSEEEPAGEIADGDEEATLADEEAAPDEGLADDFLDGMGDADAAEPEIEGNVIEEGAMEEVSGEITEEHMTATDAVDEVQVARACSDLEEIETLAELESRWGTRFLQIGNGLDIREYLMDNNDIARVTMLGERVYVNRCGAAD